MFKKKKNIDYDDQWRKLMDIDPTTDWTPVLGHCLFTNAAVCERCALKVFVLFCMVLLYLYMRIFFCGLFCKQTSAASRLKRHVSHSSLIHLRKYEIPAQGWVLNSSDGCNQRVIAAIMFFHVFSSCPCFPWSFLSCHSCIWPCSRTDSPLASEKCCFWNLVLSIQAD